MAARETRAQMAASEDVSWCPLPQVPLAAGELDAALAARRRGAHVLRAVVREGPQGPPEVIAAGDESRGAMSQQGDGTVARWGERRLVGRSVRHAPAAEAARRARVAKARAQSAARTLRGRGTKRCETVAAFRQAVVALVQRSGVENLLWCRVTPHATPRPVRASRGQPARVDHAHHATVEVCVDEAAVEAAVRRVGWRV